VPGPTDLADLPPEDPRPPAVSVVVVAHAMARELPRTVRTLTAPYQRDLDAEDIQVVVVDNGSPVPLELPPDRGPGTTVTLARLDPAPPSPARAANVGLARATAPLVGLVVDGARMASPGLLSTASLAARLADRPVIATLGWHLGPARHMDAAESGWDQRVEDELLAACGWQEDGYQLFEVSTLAGSSGRGWFGTLGESSALFMPAAMWQELGGLDEAFELPGGGLVNHDLLRRACALESTQLIVLVGEGTFHQFHGGAATSRRWTWDEMHTDYQRLRGVPFEPPRNDPIYVGRLPVAALPHVRTSVELAERRLARGRPLR
jgi:hypothetical protein